MIVFPGQVDSYRSRGNGDRLMTISYYSGYAQEVNKVLNEELGTEYMIMMIPTNSKEYEEFKDETEEQTVERMRRHMNSLIGQIAKKLNLDSKLYREDFKKELIKNGLIVESTTELKLAGYVEVIGILNKKLYE